MIHLKIRGVGRS